MDWTSLPVVDVPVASLTWPDHDLDPAHLEHPEEVRPADALPIHVERLVDGSLYIHDGRHRVLRAIARREATVPARVLEHR